MRKWIIKLFLKMNKTELAELAVEAMRELARMTDTKVDDKAVEIVATMVDDCFDKEGE
jgi:hypothetical protein